MPANEELEQAKKQHHAQLAGEHQRLAEVHARQSGGEVPTGSAGSQVGGFFGSLMEHKFWIIGGIIAVIVIFVVIVPALQGNGGANNTANSNTSPNYANGGYLPSDISSALDNINQAINGIGNQLGSGNGTTPTPPPTPPPIVCPAGSMNIGGKCVPYLPPSPVPVTGPQPGPPPVPYHPVYVTVAKWTPQNTPWNSTLSGIAQKEGISLNRIEQLNPQITNPNLIFAGNQIRVS